MASKNTITILIADPHPLARAGVTAALSPSAKGQPAFYEVATAHEAITYSARHRPQIAIIEINMPDMNGLIAAHQMLGQTNTSTRIIILTDVLEDREMERASQIGVHGWVGKDSPIEKLAEAVETVRRGQQWFDEPYKKHLGIHAEVPGYAKGKLSKFTDRELVILSLIAHGKENVEIGELLSISHRTVTTHREHITKKAGAKSAAELIKYCINAGWSR